MIILCMEPMNCSESSCDRCSSTAGFLLLMRKAERVVQWVCVDSINLSGFSVMICSFKMGVEEHIAMKKEGLRSVPEVVFGETL